MNTSATLTLLVLCSAFSLGLPPDSNPNVQTTMVGAKERRSPLVDYARPQVHKVQQVNGGKLEKDIGRETISARGFRAIQAAIPELERRKLKVNDYHIVVLQLEASLFVLFVNPEHITGGPLPKGCPGPRRCLSVELRVDDLRVIGSSVY